MKKVLIFLFSGLFLSSICFAEEAPGAAPSNQTKITETKARGSSKKAVKPVAKKVSKKSKRTNKPIKN